MKKLIILSVSLILFGAGCQTAAPPTSEANINLNTNAFTPAPAKPMENDNQPVVLSETERTNKQAVIETNKGTIVFDIFPDDAPLAASNFITLSKRGFYDGITFHRVIAGFMIQGGDPTGTGSGGPGYNFEIEPPKRAYDPGIVAMARTSLPKSNGSQFFIMEPDSTPSMLAPDYTIFGKVTKGLDVVGNIKQGDTMKKVTIEDKK
jgi:peptidyl-prolyl cis-trans isomerase B (cyclophilin B)